MNFAHWRTILWLRWRLACNQINKLGWVNRILLWLVIGFSVLGGIASFFLAVSLGNWILPATWPEWMILVWDGLVLVFLFSWIVGVLTDLQRTEPLSLNKFLHLPVSPRGVFLLNFSNSIISLSSLAFGPLMLGLSFAMIRRYGWSMSGGMVLVFVFFLMVAALTFQFRGWLALLMQDKRKRRTVITTVTVVVIMLSQIPNLLDMTLFRGRERDREAAKSAEATEREKIRQELESGQITKAQAKSREEDLNQQKALRETARFEQFMTMARQANTWVPLLWLPNGIDGIARSAWPSAFGSFAGMLAIAAYSLRRSYRSTLRLYRGESKLPVGFPASGEIGQPTKATTLKPDGSLADVQPSRWQTNWLEWKISYLSPQQAAIALMTLRNISRAPEAKLAIIAPLFAVFLLGGIMIFRSAEPTALIFRPLIAIGTCFLAMVGVSQLIQNQFGFDRDGFRALLLSPVSERDVLIGKNAATAPISLGLSCLALIAQQIAMPMYLSHFLATIFQMGTIYLVACLVGNLMSIMTPMAIASGSLKPANYKFATIILQLIIFFLAPLGMIPAVLPLGVELLVSQAGWNNYLPIYLLGSALYFAALSALYFWLIGYQADLLRERKWKILETITNVSV